MPYYTNELTQYLFSTLTLLANQKYCFPTEQRRRGRGLGRCPHSAEESAARASILVLPRVPVMCPQLRVAASSVGL